MANTILAHFLFSAFNHGIFYFLKMKRKRKKEKKNATKTIYAYTKRGKIHHKNRVPSSVANVPNSFLLRASFFIAIIIFHFMLRNIHIKPKQQQEEDRTQLLADSRPFSQSQYIVYTHENDDNNNNNK